MFGDDVDDIDEVVEEDMRFQKAKFPASIWWRPNLVATPPQNFFFYFILLKNSKYLKHVLVSRGSEMVKIELPIIRSNGGFGLMGLSHLNAIFLRHKICRRKWSHSYYLLGQTIINEVRTEP